MLAVHMCIPCMYMHTYTHVMSVWCYISSGSMYVCVHMYVCAYLYTCNAYIYAYIRNEYIMIYIKRVAWGPAFLNFLMGILQWTRETGLSLRGEIKDFLKRHLHHGNVQCLEGVKGVFILIPPLYDERWELLGQPLTKVPVLTEICHICILLERSIPVLCIGLKILFEERLSVHVILIVKMSKIVSNIMPPHE